MHTLVWRQEAEVLQKLYPNPCTLINYKNLSVLEWHYPTQVKTKRLCKSHGVNTAKCCITSEHTIQHIFILSIPLWGGKVSSSNCSGGCKRDAYFIPASRKSTDVTGKYFVSAVPATILRVTSSMISDVRIWNFATNHTTIHTNSSGLVVIHLFVCFFTRIFWTAGFTVFFRHRRCCVPQISEFLYACACRFSLRVIGRWLLGGLVVVWIYFLLFWFKHII